MVASTFYDNGSYWRRVARSLVVRYPYIRSRFQEEPTFDQDYFDLDTKFFLREGKKLNVFTLALNTVRLQIPVLNWIPRRAWDILREANLHSLHATQVFNFKSIERVKHRFPAATSKSDITAFFWRMFERIRPGVILRRPIQVAEEVLCSHSTLTPACAFFVRL